MVNRAAVVVALGGAGGALAGSGADALFLAHVGARHLGLALASSSALVAVVLAVVGAMADRVDRRKLLAGAAVAAAGGSAVLAALAGAVPAAAGIVGLVVVKQLQAAVDLGFWVVIAERLDARQARRMVPRLAAAQGMGAAAGALLVVPLAHLGVGAIFGVAAICYLATAALAARLEVGRRVAPARVAMRATWRSGLEAVRRSPLARELALVVAIAGAFGSLAFYILGAAAEQEVGGARELAQFLGSVRFGVQIVTLVAQVAIAPRLLDRAGVGVALVIAPAAAVIFTGGFEMTGVLAAAVAVQSQARLLDAAIETPAERLALGLVPGELRGRVAGFVDGTAKRAGAIAGGLGAMALAPWPRGLGAVMLAVALGWLFMAARLRRRLPGLAVAALAAPRVDVDDELGALADPRTIALVEADLAGAGAARAAEILARLHQRGRIDAVPALAHAIVGGNAPGAVAMSSIQRAPGAAATSSVARAEPAGTTSVVRTAGATATRVTSPAPASARPVVAAALVACVEHGAKPRGEVAAKLAGWAVESPDDPSAEAVVRAAGLLATGPADIAEALGPLAAGEGALGWAARVAIARATGDAELVTNTIEDALDDGALPLRRLAVREARAGLLRSLAGPDPIEPARRLVRALRRIRGEGDDDIAVLASGLDALAFLVERTESSSAEWILVKGDLVEAARRHADRRPDGGRSPAPAPVAAAALRLLGGLAEPGDDVRLLVHALGDRDDDVRDAAEAALRELGPAAAGELVEAAAYGRRAGRDRALALLRALPVTEQALDRMIEDELIILDRTLLHLGLLAELGGTGMVGRRLEERAREIGSTTLLLLSARHRGAALAACARLWRHAPDADSRARALEIVDAALPRAIAVRVTGALDEGPAAARAVAAAERLGSELPEPEHEDAAIDEAVRTELGGGDRLSRALVVHALGATGRARYRDAIASAARDAARDLSPLALLRRITGVEDDEPDDDVPTQVETLLLLGNVPLLAGLSTRQLAELAEAAHWDDLELGQVVVAAGELVDSLLVVAEGLLRVDDPSGPRTVGPGQVLDDLAVVAPAPAPAPVVAAAPTRLLRLSRVDFEELVDDVPGLAATVCRVLGARARK